MTDKAGKSRLQALVSFCESGGGIKKAAALDIRYHKDCWMEYCRPVWRQRQNQIASRERKERCKLISAVKVKAFEKLCAEIADSIGGRKEVFTLRDLLCEYESLQRDMLLTDNEIRNTCNDTVALSMLRRQIEKHFGNQIAFKSRYRRTSHP